jgi:ABC-type nitrate/sulfonate/bicarbonate transport system substrate-binding protein
MPIVRSRKSLSPVVFGGPTKGEVVSYTPSNVKYEYFLYFHVLRICCTMSAIRYVPIIVAVILAVSVVAVAQSMVSTASSSKPSIQLTVGYPDSLDESDVADLYAFQLLKAENIIVTPTFYDAPPLSYQGLISGQQDISYVNTVQAIADGPTSGQQTTCVSLDGLTGTFLMISKGITSPSQLKGQTVEDFGAGTATRALNYYWFNQTGIAVNTNAPNPSSVYLKNGGGNVARVSDLEAGRAQAIVVDDFIASDFTGSINSTGAYHILFNSPQNYFGTCYTVRDSWLANSANQNLLVKFLTAILKAQQWAISYPTQFVSFAEQQLPLTAPSEIQFASTYYPQTYAYWPYGDYNLIGPENASGIYAQTNLFYEISGQISKPVLNTTVTPYGVVNGQWELQALNAVGPYCYPHQSWVTPSFISFVNSVVPPAFGGFQGSCASSSTT